MSSSAPFCGRQSVCPLLIPLQKDDAFLNNSEDAIKMHFEVCTNKQVKKDEASPFLNVDGARESLFGK